MIKFSRKVFYTNHNKELKRYINKYNNCLLITNSSINNTYSDLNLEVIKIANSDIQNEQFNIKTDNKFDLIIITDIFEVTQDIYSFLTKLKELVNHNGKILLTSINPKWYGVLKIAEKLGLKQKSYIRSFIHPKKISNIFHSQGFEDITSYNRQIIPFRFLGIGTNLNALFELVFGFLNIGIITYFLYQTTENKKNKQTKSIIIPAKNEEGNLEELVSRIPKFEEKYELIFVCGESNDNTFEKANFIKDTYSDIDIKVFNQSKNGKANAVWEGIEKCNGELIAILDSDISVDPESLIFFFEIIESGRCDFVNGTRLLYSMEDSAMRKINKIGNRTFQFLISKLVSRNLSDTLCGTKVFKAKNLENLYKWQNMMTIKDPFCDFDLIFSSAYAGEKILEYPIHYRTRTYGSTNISRFKDGWKLILYLLNALILFKTSRK